MLDNYIDCLFVDVSIKVNFVTCRFWVRPVIGVLNLIGHDKMNYEIEIRGSREKFMKLLI